MPSPTSFWKRRLFWNIEMWELAAFLALQIFLAGIYMATLYLGYRQAQVLGITLNYLYKTVLTAPLWWLFFRRLAHWPLLKKLLLHLPACAIYVGVWIFLFYATLDTLKIDRLRGAGSWWDVYIPVLVYFIQFGIFHAYNYWQQTIRQQEKEKALLRSAHTAELNTLKAQIQPHFLFNTLNSISASIPPSEEHSRRLIAQLADVFRFAMNVTDKETVSLRDELQFIKNFLALEQQRFGDRLAVYYDVDERLYNFNLPPMLLQPLIENAVKHGIAKSIDGGSIAISIKPYNNNVDFIITDTGKGINGTPVESLFTKGIGLENTRQRLLRLYNTPLHIQNGESKGCVLRFSLPSQSKVGV